MKGIPFVDYHFGGLGVWRFGRIAGWCTGEDRRVRLWIYAASEYCPKGEQGTCLYPSDIGGLYDSEDEFRADLARHGLSDLMGELELPSGFHPCVLGRDDEGNPRLVFLKMHSS